MKKAKNRFNSILDKVAAFIFRLFTNEKILMTTKVGEVVETPVGSVTVEDQPKQKRVRKTPTERKVAVKRAKKKADENVAE